MYAGNSALERSTFGIASVLENGSVAEALVMVEIPACNVFTVDAEAWRTSSNSKQVHGCVAAQTLNQNTHVRTHTAQTDIITAEDSKCSENLTLKSHEMPHCIQVSSRVVLVSAYQWRRKAECAGTATKCVCCKNLGVMLADR